MKLDAELKKIENYISNLSAEEFDNILFDCGIESIKPSVDSDYVKCLKDDTTNSGYHKAIFEFEIKEEYFNTIIEKREVA